MPAALAVARGFSLEQCDEMLRANPQGAKRLLQVVARTQRKKARREIDPVATPRRAELARAVARARSVGLILDKAPEAELELASLPASVADPCWFVRRHGNCPWYGQATKDGGYRYEHEPLIYVRKKNAPWYGKPGECTTVWEAASPKMIMGGSDEEKFDHPTQKPVDLMRRPILNHTKRGEAVYEPFSGSGTTLAAAETLERVCLAIELDPKFVDVGVLRWQAMTGKKATLDGGRKTFDQVAEERGVRTSPPRSGRPPAPKAARGKKK